MNTKWHEQSSKTVKSFKDLDSYMTIDIRSLITIDPELLQFIHLMTCAKNDLRKRRQQLLEKPSPINEELDEKTLKHFYALCVLLFNTNRECSAPFHVALTETILCCGGSKKSRTT